MLEQLDRVLLSLALAAYLVATALALAYLIHRRQSLHRLASLTTGAGWVLHTVALVVRGVELARLPLVTLSETFSVLGWASVVLVLWAERHYNVKVLSAFALPVVLSLSLSTLTIPGGLSDLAPALRSAGVSVHALLALLGIAALVLNFAGGLMYLLQERQLKSKRPGPIYYRLPSLEALDRLTFRALTFGFPVLTAGLILGVAWAGPAWGSLVAFDALAVFSSVAWVIYAATLAGRAVAGWRGRRAAYFAIAAFTLLVLTLGAGAFFPGQHWGS